MMKPSASMLPLILDSGKSCSNLLRSMSVTFALFVSDPAAAQYANGAVKIGVLTDMSSLYADGSGPGSVAAARLAVEDFDPASKGMKVEIVAADHLNKPDVGSNIANSWFDVDKVDAIVDVPNSAVALAVSEIARQKNRVFLASGAATSELTGSRCNANTVQWTYDTWNLANSVGRAVVQSGGDSWFFVTVDYAFGLALERETAAVVEANRGAVVGRVRHPLNTSDFSSFLLQARSSGAKVIGLANAGGDFINSVKQAKEFGIGKGGQRLAGLLVTAVDVAALGLSAAQGLMLMENWYWDMNENNRAWTRRWQARQPGKVPTMLHAGVYSAVTHYLKAVAALETDDNGRTAIAKMKEMPTEDRLFGKGLVRADGRKIHDSYLFEVKAPEQSRYFGDFYEMRATIPAAAAFRPLKDGGCPLVQG
jgi:branched-chain amino acid transport system substrate-binding protein